MKRKLAIATKHGKETLLAPLFHEKLGWELVLAPFDTDTLGTFSGETPRTLSPKDAALAKARKAIEISGLEMGLGSEGSIYPNPSIPLVSLNTEVLALVDTRLGFELVVSHTSDQVHSFKTSWTMNLDLEKLGARAGFPEHGLIALSSQGVIKGISSVEQLERAIDDLGPSEELSFESDFRAMHSKSRRENILACAKKLVERIQTKCPSCNAPGFGQIGFEFGLPCSDCGTTNPGFPALEISGCLACDHKVERALDQRFIGPESCLVCNP